MFVFWSYLPAPISALPTWWTLYLLFFFSLKPIKSHLCCPHTLGCVAFHWCMLTSLSATPLKRSDFLLTSYQLSIASHLSETSWPPLLSILGFGLVWGCIRLVYAAMLLWARMSNCPAVSRKLSCSHPSSQVLIFFLCPLLQWSLSFWRMCVITDF